ncbi:MAG: hypothetical protein ACRDQ1_12475 [Sciscionella sp.]
MTKHNRLQSRAEKLTTSMAEAPSRDILDSNPSTEEIRGNIQRNPAKGNNNSVLGDGAPAQSPRSQRRVQRIPQQVKNTRQPIQFRRGQNR